MQRLDQPQGPRHACAPFRRGRLDPRHRVAVADLILVHSRVRHAIEKLVHEIAPDMVGLSVMTFPRKTALRIIALLRRLSGDRVRARANWTSRAEATEARGI